MNQKAADDQKAMIATAKALKKAIDDVAGLDRQPPVNPEAIPVTRRRWEAHFGAALAPDSNLNTASGARTIFLDTPFGRLPFILGGDRSAKSGIGVSLWGGGEYQHPLTDRMRLRAGAASSTREYKGREFDRRSIHAHIGPRRLLGPRTEASLLAVAQRQWSAGRPDTDEFGLRLEGQRRLTPRLALDGRIGARRCNVRSRD